jgi:hypothetical protein
VNEKLRTIDEAFEAENGRQAITCECADLECVQTIEIDRDAYSRVRQNARHFVVQRGHVLPGGGGRRE